MENQRSDGQPVVWRRDVKLLVGFLMVVLSIIAGLFGKGLLIAKFYEPVYLLTGLSVWAFSWLLLFVGVFLIGWETVKMIQHRIHHHVKKTVKGTYQYTKELPKRGYNYTKELRRKGVEKATKKWLRQH